MTNNVTSEYTHISNSLKTIETKIDSLTTEISAIKTDLSNLDSVTNDLDNSSKKILAAAERFKTGCSRLENYLNYIQNTFFPNLEYKLVTKIELCSNSTVDKIKEEVELYGKKTENAMIENQDELMKLLNTINNKLN